MPDQLGQNLLDDAPRTADRHTMSTVVNVYEAKSHFSELLGRAEAGEDIVIARHGRPIVQLVAVSSRRPDRVLGQAAGRIRIAEDFDDPISDLEAGWFDSAIEPA